MRKDKHTIHRGALAVLFAVSMTVLKLQAGSDTDLVFHAPYDGATGSVQGVEALHKSGLTFVPGVRGQAVRLGEKSSVLTYPGDEIFKSPAGSVEFWVQPGWNGYLWNEEVPMYMLFGADAAGKGGDEDSRMRLFMWNWLRFDYLSKPERTPTSLEWKGRNAWMQGDWWHICLTWNDGKTAIYVNGDPGSSNSAAQLADVKTFSIGGIAGRPGDVAIDELRIYRTALDAKEIQQRFREVAAVDFTFERRVLRADTEEKILLEAVPGGGVALPVKGTLSLRLVSDRDGSTVTEKHFDLNLSDRTPFTLDVGKLPVGEYRLAIRLDSGSTHYDRSFPVAANAARPAMPASKEPLQRGELLFDKDCTKIEVLKKGETQIKELNGVPYLEAGSAKEDRFSFETQIPQADGSPVLLEWTWPDDVARAMGLYMYPKGAKGFGQHRERLYAGIMAGEEYPSSDRMQTASYLFFPVIGDNLFEARTLISGMPAALGSVKAYRLGARLPRLEIQLPANRPGRVLGHLDEDQSFEYQIAPVQDGKDEWRRHPYDYPVRVMNSLLDYMDYSGLQVISYPLARYTWTHQDDGPINTLGDNFRVAGFTSLMLDMMAERQKQLIASINLFAVPARPGAAPLPVDDARYCVKRDGTLVGNLCDSNNKTETGIGTNPVHPAVRARMLEIVSEILRRYGQHPAFKGIDLWCSPSSPFLFGVLENSYDDFTVALFESETGSKIPSKGTGKGRFAERFHHLTGPAQQQWLAWRAKKTTELFQEIDMLVRKTRPDLRCYVSVGGWYEATPSLLAKADAEQFSFEEYAHKNLSLDFQALKKLPSVVVVPQKDMTNARWIKHRNGREQETVLTEMNWKPSLYTGFSTGNERSVSLYLRYFESFAPSLKQDIYPAYFQDCDAKPHGRFFLQDFAVAVAAQDASQILVGAQSLGAAGREAETREFAQAFCALPRDRFTDVTGNQDPVTIREFSCEEGTYFYAVNLMSAPVSVPVKIKSKSELVVNDLSTGDPVALKDGRIEVELKPFQLRSFFCPKEKVTLSPGKVQIPEAVKNWYRSQVLECRELVGKIHDDDEPMRTKLIEEMELCLAEGRLAELHRLLYSKRILTMRGLATDAAAGYLEEKSRMIARSEYAVNCGGKGFYRAKSGRLFFPDQVYPGKGYGRDEESLCIERSTTGLHGSDDTELFATEAYTLSSYRFDVKPGLYTVRLYFKVGFESSARPGVFVFDVAAGGKTILSDFDLFEACGKDFNGIKVAEFKDVAVSDGVLKIAFTPSPGVDPSVTLCNAIEIIPQSAGKSGA